MVKILFSKYADERWLKNMSNVKTNNSKFMIKGNPNNNGMGPISMKSLIVKVV